MMKCTITCISASNRLFQDPSSTKITPSHSRGRGYRWSRDASSHGYSSEVDGRGKERESGNGLITMQTRGGELSRDRKSVKLQTRPLGRREVRGAKREQTRKENTPPRVEVGEAWR
ncbi:unnamed protein product [Protopolystoma xenopodis]|uniref:Uncharacterized protein n=1 Tax=Protopolystoma xenopodis TaxID=117903 RepID=A0A3S5A5C5_9PLAT|nr:unnamed protein product [Protopolystoma xenopodis]